MTHISGEDRSQLLLLPDVVDDYVGPDSPVRFILALGLEEPVDRLTKFAARDAVGRRQENACVKVRGPGGVGSDE